MWVGGGSVIGSGEGGLVCDGTGHASGVKSENGRLDCELFVKQSLFYCKILSYVLATLCCYNVLMLSKMMVVMMVFCLLILMSLAVKYLFLKFLGPGESEPWTLFMKTLRMFWGEGI